jgi:hypothetical protein
LSFEGGISGNAETAVLWTFPAVFLKLSYRSGNSAWVMFLSYERMLRTGAAGTLKRFLASAAWTKFVPVVDIAGARVSSSSWR